MPHRTTSRSRSKPPAGRAGLTRVTAAVLGEGGMLWRKACQGLEAQGVAGVETRRFRLGDLPIVRSAVEELAAADAAVLFADAPLGMQALLRAAAVLSETGTPALAVIAPALEAARERLELAGLCVLDDDVEPAVLGGLVAGLALRQPAVRRLQGDLRDAWRAQEQAGAVLSRVDEELRLAARVQRQMLPATMPDAPGWSFETVYRPASYVSGDVYRVERLPDGRIGVLLADVMGHGVRAAMHSVLVARSLPMIERLGDQARVLPPGAALARLNAEMLQHRRDDANFATAVYAVVDPVTGEVVLASAGHPPALVLGAPGTRRFLEASGPMLGVFDEAEFVECRVTLDRTESLMLYSDGLEQAMANAVHPAPKGAALLEAAVHLLANAAERGVQSGQGAADAMHVVLDGQNGSLHNGDDVSVLLLRRA